MLYLTLLCKIIQQSIPFYVTKIKVGKTMSIGKRIKKLRAELNLSSAQLAQNIDIPVRTIGSYERNEVQPGSKFLTALIDCYYVNVNWLLTGKGNMFISKKTNIDLNYVKMLKEQFNLTEEEISGLLEILETEASRDMVMKFIEVKHGNKEVLDSLIYNLQGIKAIYG